MQKHHNEKEASKKQNNDLGQKITKDVETYEEEQKRKKRELIEKY